MNMFWIVLLFGFAVELHGAVNNVCPTFKDYYTIRENPRCWYDFTADSNVTEIIRKHGYPLEIHRVVTPDGYILTVFRIPNNRIGNHIIRKEPVFLQHGLVSTSANFVALGKNSIAFVLADAGYDVWLGNFRGNEYSEGHINLTVFDKAYWDHSIDEIGLYDVPVQLELVAQTTGHRGNIIYIGHSLGTTIGLIYGSALPELAKKTVKLFVLLAPAGILANMVSPLRFLAPMADQILTMVQDNDLIRLMSQAEPVRKSIAPLCLETPNLMERCIRALNLFYGPRTQMDPNMIPVYFNQLPGGTSMKVTRHAADLALNIFGRYNFGVKNLKKYGTIFPPIYDVSKIEVPVFIVYAVNDWTCSKKDSLILYNDLPPKAKIHGMYEVSDPDFNHIDFIFGRNVRALVYDVVLKLLEKIGQN